MKQPSIPFDPTWRNVAVSVSGGADSALLAYLVCSLADGHDTTVHVINHIRCWKSKPWQQQNADDVYNWLVDRFDGINFVRHTNFIAPEFEYGNMGASLTDEYGKQVSGDNIQQRAYGEYICTTYDIDAYYNGVTRNPRTAMFTGMVERDLEPTDDNRHLEYMVHMGRVVSHPFRFVDKSWVMGKYLELKLYSLLSVTRSCEGVFDEIDYTTYIKGQYVPVCGQCFWCKEREWAINENTR